MPPRPSGPSRMSDAGAGGALGTAPLPLACAAAVRWPAWGGGGLGGWRGGVRGGVGVGGGEAGWGLTQ